MATQEVVAAQVPEPDAVISELDAMGLNEDGSPKDPKAENPASDNPGEQKPPVVEDEKDKQDDKDLTPEQREERKHRSAQRRINKAIREQRDAERRASAAEVLLEETRKANERLLAAIEKSGGRAPDTTQEPSGKPDEKPPAAEKPPKYEDFDTLDEFLEARDEYRDRQRAAKEPEKKPDAAPADKPGEKKPLTPEQELRFERFAEIKARAEADPAYQQAVFKDLTITNVMADSILDQDNFDEVIDYFVANPAAARKIANMEATGKGHLIAGAIAGIAETIADDDDAAPPDKGDSKDLEGDPDPIPDKPDDEGTPPPRKPAVSSAPPPIKPVRAGSGSRSTKSPDEMSQAEYEEWRKKGGGR